MTRVARHGDDQPGPDLRRIEGRKPVVELPGAMDPDRFQQVATSKTP